MTDRPILVYHGGLMDGHEEPMIGGLEPAKILKGEEIYEYRFEETKDGVVRLHYEAVEMDPRLAEIEWPSDPASSGE